MIAAIPTVDGGCVMMSQRSLTANLLEWNGANSKRHRAELPAHSRRGRVEEVK